MTDELNLDDPKIVEQLMRESVTDTKPDEEVAQVEKKIRSLKQTKVSIELSPQEIEILQREAGTLNLDWKEYLKQQVKKHCFDHKHVGRPLISRPSAYNQTITGPTYSVKRG